MAFAIVNRSPAGSEAMPVALAWRTCLRGVLFLDENEMPPTGGQFAEEGDAYRLLLEILCGLQSPMIGEKQVLGQFKSVLSTLGPDATWLNRLGQRLLADAREVRTKHLQGLGSGSYGSAIRRYLGDCAQAAVIGTGTLALEILPFLAENGRHVDQWGRAETANAVGGQNAAYHVLDHCADQAVSELSTALVIAAPAPTDVIKRVASRYSQLQRIVDLRADADAGSLLIAAPIITLQELFDRMTSMQQSAAPKIEAARSDIACRSLRFALRDQLRPFGWDDLCA